MPRPLSTTVTDPSALMAMSIFVQYPARASSTELSTTSYTRWCRPFGPVDPMYMLGRLRTASSPSSTWMSLAEYELLGTPTPSCSRLGERTSMHGGHDMSWFLLHSSTISRANRLRTPAQRLLRGPLRPVLRPDTLFPFQMPRHRPDGRLTDLRVVYRGGHVLHLRALLLGQRHRLRGVGPVELLSLLFRLGSHAFLSDLPRYTEAHGPDQILTDDLVDPLAELLGHERQLVGPYGSVHVYEQLAVAQRDSHRVPRDVRADDFVPRGGGTAREPATLGIEPAEVRLRDVVDAASAGTALHRAS